VKNFIFRYLGKKSLYSVWQDMKLFTENRDQNTKDEVWFVEHYPVFTMGMNANYTHILDSSKIPILELDRGGQVTYHGPGQLVVYMMFDLKRLGIGVRKFVTSIENIIISAVKNFGIKAEGKMTAPGVYVQDKKLAAIGLRIRKHCSYHGFSLNIDMDTQPFHMINPCGYEGLEITQLKDLCSISDTKVVSKIIEKEINSEFNNKK
tara:strand:+ start:10969 stop:11586 length:618 start_codon:yes stop_codon:yes gene_type:complete